MNRFVLSFTALSAVLAVAACSDPEQQGAATSGSGSNMGGGYAAGPAPVGQGGMIDAQRLAQLQREFQSQVGDRVYFDTDSVSITGEARGTLDRQAAFLSRYPTLTLTIEGHADERGTREYNLALGDRRAQSVKEYLQARGVNPARLRTISYGKERPEALGSGPSAWAKNRRGVSVLGQ